MAGTATCEPRFTVAAQTVVGYTQTVEMMWKLVVLNPTGTQHVGSNMPSAGCAGIRKSVLASVKETRITASPAQNAPKRVPNTADVSLPAREASSALVSMVEASCLDENAILYQIHALEAGQKLPAAFIQTLNVVRQEGD